MTICSRLPAPIRCRSSTPSSVPVKDPASPRRTVPMRSVVVLTRHLVIDHLNAGDALIDARPKFGHSYRSSGPDSSTALPVTSPPVY